MALPLLGIAVRGAITQGVLRAGRTVQASGQNIAFSVIRNDLAGGRVLNYLQPEVRRDVNGIATSLHSSLKADTPKATGQASRGWRRKNTQTGFEITNTVDHIGALNEGSSKQAPRNYVGKTIRNTQIK